jgi:hypothetical protein
MLHNAPIAFVSFRRTYFVALQRPSRFLSVRSLRSNPLPRGTKTNGAGHPKETESSQKRYLEPHVLSTRLKKLCGEGNPEKAVALLKNAPLDAQNPPVWNTLIRECMKADKYSLSYKLFTDVSKAMSDSPTNLSTDSIDEASWIQPYYENLSDHVQRLVADRELEDSHEATI